MSDETREVINQKAGFGLAKNKWFTQLDQLESLKVYDPADWGEKPPIEPCESEYCARRNGSTCPCRNNEE